MEVVAQLTADAISRNKLFRLLAVHIIGHCHFRQDFAVGFDLLAKSVVGIALEIELRGIEVNQGIIAVFHLILVPAV